MPQIDNAAASQGVTGEQVEKQTATEPASLAKSVLEKLGVPVELHGEIGKGISPNVVADEKDDEPESEAPSASETKAEAETDVSQKDTKETAEATAETEAEADYEHEHEQDQEEAEDKPPADAKPGWERKRIGQLARQKRELKERLEELEAQIGEGAQGKEQVFVDRGADPLAHITTPDALQKIREDARQLRKWCHVNREGATVEPGTDKERVIEPGQVAQWLSEAEDLLDEHIPRKATQLQQRVADDELAKTVYPPLFDKRSQEYQIGKMLDRELPGLATHPSRNLVIGDYLAGAKARIEREAKRNGNGARAENDKPKLPEALTRNQKGHIPPIAPETARVPSNSPAVPHARKLVADATKNVIEEGGSMDSIKRLILAKRQANSTNANPRSAVAV